MKKRFRKDYHNKNYKNPYFRRQKENKPKQSRLKLSSCLLIIAIVGWFIFLFFTPYFILENIDFSETSEDLEKKIKLLLNAEFEKRRFLLFSNQNYFVFNTENLKDHLGAIFLLNELKIEKKFPNTLVIKAKEKSDVLVLITPENAFFVDKRGLVVDVVPENFKTYEIDTEAIATTTIDSIEINPAKMVLADEIVRKMPVLQIDGIDEANVRDEVLSEDLVGLVLGVHQNLLNKLGISPELFEIKDIEEGRMNVKIDEGWEIYFLINEPIDNQLENLKVILMEKVGENRGLLKYIDLRFGDKIYFKFNE